MPWLPTAELVGGRFNPCEQVRRRDAQRVGEPLDDRDRRVARTAFDVRDVSAVDACLERKLLLAQALRLAKTTYVPTEALANIHPRLVRRCRPSIYRRRVTIDLTSLRVRASVT